MGGVHTNQLGQEKRDTNRNGCQIRRLVLFRRNHDDDKHQLGREEHLDEQALDITGATTESRVHGERAREQSRNNARSSYATEKLSNDDDCAADGRQTANEDERQCDLFSSVLPIPSQKKNPPD